MKVDKLDVNTDELAETIRSDEYYAQARQWFSEQHHTPIAERNQALVMAIVALSILCMLCGAFYSLLPLSPAIPLIIKIPDISSKTASVKTISSPGENINVALMRYLAGNYVKLREEYDVEGLNRRINGVKSQTDEEAFSDYRAFMNPQNPSSPLSLYERRAIRRISILSTELFTKTAPLKARVVFDAAVIGDTKTRRSTFIADITFRYTLLKVDENTHAVTPMQFQVTGYNVKEQ